MFNIIYEFPTAKIIFTMLGRRIFILHRFLFELLAFRLLYKIPKSFKTIFQLKTKTKQLKSPLVQMCAINRSIQMCAITGIIVHILYVFLNISCAFFLWDIWNSYCPINKELLDKVLLWNNCYWTRLLFICDWCAQLSFLTFLYHCTWKSDMLKMSNCLGDKWKLLANIHFFSDFLKFSRSKYKQKTTNQQKNFICFIEVLFIIINLIIHGQS